MSKLDEQVLSAQKCLNLSDKIDRYFTEPVAMLFSKLFLKLNFHPNLVTFFSIISGVAGGLFFVPKNLWYNLIGIALEILAAVFDASDGQVARLSGKKSEFGRFFDGIGDGLVYISIYFGVCVHIMTDKIPFTNVEWGFWIWPICAVCGFVLHTSQARIADYFRNVHMYLSKNNRGNELSKAKTHKKKCEKGGEGFLQTVMHKFFYSYTKSQEKSTPKLQKLLNAIENDGNTVSDQLANDFALESNKIVRRTNLLTYNARTYPLFILIVLSSLVHYPCFVFIFPIIIFVLEPIKICLIKRYEKIADKLYEKYYKD